jgi:quinoprotein glucose dehydrogenase
MKTLLVSLTLVAAISATAADRLPDQAWPSYAGAPGGGQYSPLAQIDRNNVGRLHVAWSFRTGEDGAGMYRRGSLTFEANPLMVDGRLYIPTATGKLFALDPATGKPVWTFDAKINRHAYYGDLASRGVSTWVDSQVAADAACHRRILMTTLDARMIELDAATGKPCTGFGSAGTVNLLAGVHVRDKGGFSQTSPPAIIGDIAIVGASIGDNRAADEEQGVVRAFDLRTGRQLWAWDPIPRTAAAATAMGWQPAQAATVGGANAWPPLSVDAALGLVYVPTGSASPDYAGTERLGDNRDADSLVALHANDGTVAWRQQLVHHDLWDYDQASQPVLTDIDTATGRRPVVIQGTKTGFLFVFDRRTGEPVFPIHEMPVPPSDVPGEVASATQPVPDAGLMLARHAPVTAADAWGVTPWERDACAKHLGSLRSKGLFTPPSLQGTLVSPGWAGGINWGGVAVDPERQIAVTYVMDLPMEVALIPRAEYDARDEDADEARYPHLGFSDMAGTPYAMRRGVILSPDGVPCTAPPWGKMVVVDLRRGKVLWERPLGTIESTTGLPLEWGVPGMGGSVVTAGGLIFIAATVDERFRAIDVDSGRTLWEEKLPAAGNATPSVYAVDGKQYVVISAGGHGSLGTPKGDYVIAYTLDGQGPTLVFQHRFAAIVIAVLAVPTFILAWWYRRRRRRSKRLAEAGQARAV